jgi:hypothetical protein
MCGRRSGSVARVGEGLPTGPSARVGRDEGSVAAGGDDILPPTGSIRGRITRWSSDLLERALERFSGP